MVKRCPFNVSPCCYYFIKYITDENVKDMPDYVCKFATAVGHKKCLEKCVIDYTNVNDLYSRAVFYNRLDMLKYIYSSTGIIPDDKHIINMAIFQKNMKIIIYLMQFVQIDRQLVLWSLIEFDRNICAYLLNAETISGHDIIQIIYNGLRLSILDVEKLKTIYQATDKHIPQIQYLDMPLSIMDYLINTNRIYGGVQRAFDAAITTRNEKVIKHLIINHQIHISQLHVKFIIQREMLQVLLLISNNFAFNHEHFTMAIHTGNKQLLGILHFIGANRGRNGDYWAQQCVSAARVSSLEYIYETGIRFNAILCAIKTINCYNDQLRDIFDFLLNIIKPRDMDMLYIYAIICKNEKCIQHLCYRQLPVSVHVLHIAEIMEDDCIYNILKNI